MRTIGELARKVLADTALAREEWEKGAAEAAQVEATEQSGTVIPTCPDCPDHPDDGRHEGELMTVFIARATVRRSSAPGKGAKTGGDLGKERPGARGRSTGS